MRFRSELKGQRRRMRIPAVGARDVAAAAAAAALGTACSRIEEEEEEEPLPASAPDADH